MRSIKLTQGKLAIVDDWVFDLYKDVPFHASKVGKVFYARTSRTLLPGRVRTYLHHIVAGIPPDSKWMTEFKDGNPLNCQRENLRFIRKSNNTQRNSKIQKGRSKSSKYLGVTFRPAHYRAVITYNGKRINIGEYATETEAAKAYNEYAIKLFGDDAKLNTLTK